MLSRQGGGFGGVTLDGAGTSADPLLIPEIGRTSGPVTILGFRWRMSPADRETEFWNSALASFNFKLKWHDCACAWPKPSQKSAHSAILCKGSRSDGSEAVSLVVHSIVTTLTRRLRPESGSVASNNSLKPLPSGCSRDALIPCWAR